MRKKAMDAIGLLGNLMGNNAVSPSPGGGLLGSLLGGALGGGAGGMLGSATGSGTLGTLGNVLGGAIGGTRGGGSASGFGSKALMGVLGALATAAVTKYARNKMSRDDAPADGGLTDIDPDEVLASTGYDEHEANSRAEILIRAMINAAKSDGHVDEQERQNILQRVGDVDREEAAFLRHELSSPLDVQGFIRSVPRGMEREVYAMSLMGIALDEDAEAQYLLQLAQGLGLNAETCNSIHRDLGAPEIFN
jgi:uncharacterized membrane protein YebE (DUF533 family)